MISTQDIRDKEIINILDGKSLGYVSDIEVNLERGRIEALIVPSQRGLFGMFSDANEYIIRWKDIKKIGEDVILAEVHTGNDYGDYKDTTERDRCYSRLRDSQNWYNEDEQDPYDEQDRYDEQNRYENEDEAKLFQKKEKAFKKKEESFLKKQEDSKPEIKIKLQDYRQLEED